jgi:hypothetical protein
MLLTNLTRKRGAASFTAGDTRARMQYPETAQFDSEMRSRKVMGFVIWPFTIQEKSLLLVVARHQGCSKWVSGIGMYFLKFYK